MQKLIKKITVLLLVCLVTNNLPGIEVAKAPVGQVLMVDMIPLVNGHLENVYVDSTLFQLEVPKYNGENASDALQYLMGISLANDLKLSTKDRFTLLQANDIARVTTIDSDISAETVEALQGLRWDFLPHRGKYVVEYPIGHQDIMDALNNVQNEPVVVEIIITNMANDTLKRKGIALNEYIQGNINFFDFFTNKDVSKWQSIQGGFRIDLSREDVQDMLDVSTTLKATSILGAESRNSILTSVPYETFQRDRDGFTTERSVQFIEAGLDIKTITTKVSDQYMIDFAIEMSDIVPSGEVPIVSKRLSFSKIVLSKGEVNLVATLLVEQLSDRVRKGLFGSTKTDKTRTSDQVHIFAKLL
jgi:hypothetical protein